MPKILAMQCVLLAGLGSAAYPCAAAVLMQTSADV